MLPIIKQSKIWLTLSALLVILSLAFLPIFGLNLSADFVPGTMLKISFQSPPEPKAIESYLLEEFNPTLQNLSTENPDTSYTQLIAPEVRLLADSSISIRTIRLSQPTQAYLLGLNQNTSPLIEKFGEFEVQETRNISPTFAESFRNNSLIAITLASFAIILYIAYAFRRVPRHVNAWKFGLVAVLTLLHDVIITLGIFVLLGHFLSVEINGLFITALLTVVGYSVNDTIVVFDRIRENLKNINRHQSFGDIAEISVNQSIARSFNTSLSTLITLTALALLGAESIRWFLVALIIGTIIGTYSSLFLASPLLTLWQRKYR